MELKGWIVVAAPIISVAVFLLVVALLSVITAVCCHKFRKSEPKQVTYPVVGKAEEAAMRAQAGELLIAFREKLDKYNCVKNDGREFDGIKHEVHEDGKVTLEELHNYKREVDLLHLRLRAFVKTWKGGDPMLLGYNKDKVDAFSAFCRKLSRVKVILDKKDKEVTGQGIKENEKFGFNDSEVVELLNSAKDEVKPLLGMFMLLVNYDANYFGTYTKRVAKIFSEGRGVDAKLGSSLVDKVVEFMANVSEQCSNFSSDDSVSAVRLLSKAMEAYQALAIVYDADQKNLEWLLTEDEPSRPTDIPSDGSASVTSERKRFAAEGEEKAKDTPPGKAPGKGV